MLGLKCNLHDLQYNECPNLINKNMKNTITRVRKIKPNIELTGSFTNPPEVTAPNAHIIVNIIPIKTKHPKHPLVRSTTAPEPHLGQRRQPLTMYQSYFYNLRLYIIISVILSLFSSPLQFNILVKTIKI
ncbi:hypothetical protein SEVCU129_1430 [Staphylococcus epidermidis VCU129]|nr:hypothetical protein SEVCU129_1430 [Staphylococcus epidermidis VCU129]KTT58895.1 hypothetical protein SB7C_11410 [Staphylococcus epidermidis]KTT81642.1 hypothetical protein SA6_03185 [Staphylococcus epidermidis]KTT98178.1 hypothetical protein SA8_11040 [Staphylococcus epidermidis]MBM0761013.1 hypothetical protein [Staphylococcus epidermidis]